MSGDPLREAAQAVVDDVMPLEDGLVTVEGWRIDALRAALVAPAPAPAYEVIDKGGSNMEVRFAAPAPAPALDRERIRQDESIWGSRCVGCGFGERVCATYAYKCCPDCEHVSYFVVYEP